MMPINTKWTLKAPTLQDFVVLCAQMRPDEVEQWRALVDPDCMSNGRLDFEKAAVWCYQVPGLKFSLFAGDRLLLAGGYFQVTDGVYRSWMVGTMDAWRDHWRSITEATRFVMDCIFEDGSARRLETYVLDSRALTAKWYARGLKMEREGVLRGYGYGGENVAVYSRLAPAPVPISEVLGVT